VTGEDIDGNVARINVKKTYENGREMKGYGKLINEAGNWKLDNLLIKGGQMGVGEHRL